MKLERYEAPESLARAWELLEQPGARPLAGGTDLIPRMRAGVAGPSLLVDLRGIAELCVFENEADGLLLGAMTRLSNLQRDKRLSGAHRVLCACAGHVSSMQIRNMATLGGNSCNASPSADTAPGLLLLDAQARICSAKGERRLPMEQFYVGPGRTALMQGELLTGVFLPRPLPRTGAAYQKYAIRGDSDISIVGAGACFTLDEGGSILRARLAFASVGPRTLRLQEAESVLTGQAPTAELLCEAAECCARACTPIDDQRASAAYRRKMVRLWAQKAMEQALLQAGGIV